MMKVRIHFAQILRALGAAGLMLASACSGSSEPISADAGTAPVDPASSGGARGGAGAGGGDAGRRTPPSGAGPGTDAGPQLASCEVEGDCEGACPAGAKGCTCAATPKGKVCIPTCATSADCPKVEGPALTCSSDQTCVPEGS